MSRKCEGCDTVYNLRFVPDEDGYMCDECYYEEYHRYEFNQGRHDASDAIANGDVYDIQAAIDSFITDPASSPSEYGYLHELKNELEN